MIETALLLTNEKSSWYQVPFLNNEIMDRKISDKKSALGYYSMLYQHHMWKADKKLQHQELSYSHLSVYIIIATVTNVYIKAIFKKNG